ncbi:MAG: hypothetical protein GY832_07845 [Chloroflexi bacterium]|nr:hypothetical protein [Chloroflexota bacterium]
MDILENRKEWVTSFREGWLGHYERTGTFDWDLYPLLKNKIAPAGPGVDLSASRLMLISSAGGYLTAEQEPFDADHPLGDYTIRSFPTSTSSEQLTFAHNHYDHTAVNQDLQVLIPLRHLNDLVAEGVIGELAPSAVSFMGYQPDVSRVVDEMIPPILQVAQREQVRAALLVPA